MCVERGRLGVARAGVATLVGLPNVTTQHASQHQNSQDYSYSGAEMRNSQDYILVLRCVLSI